MGNVTLPTPVFAAGGALCLLGGYLIGVVSAPHAPERSTATVRSFDDQSAKLCLAGDGVDGHPGVHDGQLCGTWRRAAGSRTPEPGEQFRFVSLQVDNVGPGGDKEVGPDTVIYGRVAPG